MKCPKCGGNQTRVLAGGFVLCQDCERAEAERTMKRDVMRFQREVRQAASCSVVEILAQI